MKVKLTLFDLLNLDFSAAVDLTMQNANQVK